MKNPCFQAIGFVTLAAMVWVCAHASAEELPRITLRNGAQLEAEVLKENANRLYLDLGYQVLDVPREDIAARENPTTATASLDEGLLQSGTADDWEAFSRDAHARRERRSPSQVLEQAKRGVVIVSTPSGFGAGFVIDRQGHILTNQHVVLDEKFVDVTFIMRRGGRVLREKIQNVEIVALSPLFDIALLALPGDALDRVELHPLPLAPDGALQDGDAVFAIGNPGMGREILDYTLSEGIVSSLTRNFGDVLYIQTTAPVNPGNSGGPLINAYGQVVGLVSLKAFFQEGIAFALPIDLMQFFLRHGKAFAYGKANPNTGYHYLPPE